MDVCSTTHLDGSRQAYSLILAQCIVNAFVGAEGLAKKEHEKNGRKKFEFFGKWCPIPPNHIKADVLVDPQNYMDLTGVEDTHSRMRSPHHHLLVISLVACVLLPTLMCASSRESSSSSSILGKRKCGERALTQILVSHQTYVKLLDNQLVEAFNASRPGQFIALLKGAQEGYAGEDARLAGNRKETQFGCLVSDFFAQLNPLRNSAPLERFLTLHAEGLSKQYPDIYEVFSSRLIHYLSSNQEGLEPNELLVGLMGQHLPLTPRTFAKGFMFYRGRNHSRPSEFVAVAWREAVEAILDEGNQYEIRRLLAVINAQKLDMQQFSLNPPLSPASREIFLSVFKTKHMMEEEWTAKNVVNFRLRLLTVFEDLIHVTLLPTVLMRIVSDYVTTATWLDIIPAQ